jgi:hypothetical protein
MSISIPKCALRGLSLEEVQFNSLNCPQQSSSTDVMFNWTIGLNSCGTILSESSNGVIRYQNSLKTYINESQ